MSLLDALKPRVKLPEKVPADIDDKVRRGRERMHKDRFKRRLFQKFWEGDHYWYLNTSGGLSFQTSGMAGIVDSTKSAYRIRNTYNYVQLIVEAKVSAATQKVPGYEVTPSTDDSDDEAAASLAGQVAFYGYDKWRLRRRTTEAVTNALVQREAFAMPYFDPNVGPFTRDPETGEMRGQGEVKVLVFTRDEVMWEPGQAFDDSRWHGVERAMLKDEVRDIPGFVGGALETDAQAGEAPDGKTSPEMVLVTQYLERPCVKYPQGRRVFVANGRPIVDYRLDPECDSDWTDWWEPYPCMDANGEVSDEPVLHHLSYTVNPNGDDLGLVERIIDLQRTVTDCWNKILELKNRALMLQMLVPKSAGAFPRRDDTPGANWFYGGSVKPEWEKAPDPQLLAQLVLILRMAMEELRALSADVDVQAQPDLAARTANAAIEQAAQRWQSFLGDLAEFHSRLMRSCLSLVARYYTEQRQIDIRGQYGWQPMSAFSGQDLRSQVNVRVLPGSLESKSRQAIRQEIEFIQANWPGAITPEAALATMHGGSGEGLIRSYQNDVAKAWRIVRRLRTGPEAMNSFPTRWDPLLPRMEPDPVTGSMFGVDVPGWMPAPQDNIQIWRQVIGDYMKTEDYEKLDDVSRNNFQEIWNGLERAEQDRAAKQAAQQQMQAESLGMSAAAKPQMPPPLPDRAGFTPDNQSPVEAPA